MEMRRTEKMAEREKERRKCVLCLEGLGRQKEMCV